jgi:glycosyltransferase involved in cell wall biosynthesis
MRILALYTDAFGGYGGISVSNRHFLRGLCAWDRCEEVVGLPLLMPNEPEETPANFTTLTGGLGSRIAYVQTALSAAIAHGPFDAVWCGHLDLVSLAAGLKTLTRSLLLQQIHGIDAWDPPDPWLRRRLVRAVDHFIAVSSITKERFLDWAPLDARQGSVLPNTIDFSPFSPGPKRRDLVDTYDLNGRFVLMTMGRLVSRDRAKGFDVILDLLPRLAEDVPNVTYLIAGKGPDRERLDAKARRLGVRERVVFTGYVPEDEKADYFRLADLYVMPSRGEGFGLVLLEAMACGVPVVASTRDGGCEAVLDGNLGALADPTRPDAVRRAILDHARSPSSPNRERLHDAFGWSAYTDRLHAILSSALGGGSAAFAPIYKP